MFKDCGQLFHLTMPSEYNTVLLVLNYVTKSFDIGIISYTRKSTYKVSTGKTEFIEYNKLL